VGWIRAPSELPNRIQLGVDVARTLRAAGHEAWFVGGCVRDRLLHRPLGDIDLCTDARRLGAAHFALSSDKAGMSQLKDRFDLLVSTVSAQYELNPFLELLKVDRTMVLIGVPPKALGIEAHNLIMRRRQLAGSVIGGIPETQEMLDFCATKKVLADVEVIPMAKINEAYERMLKSDVRYRFVLDMKTL